MSILCGSILRPSPVEMIGMVRLDIFSFSGRGHWDDKIVVSLLDLAWYLQSQDHWIGGGVPVMMLSTSQIWVETTGTQQFV
jgi:hypothetical protein